MSYIGEMLLDQIQRSKHGLCSIQKLLMDNRTTFKHGIKEIDLNNQDSTIVAFKMIDDNNQVIAAAKHVEKAIKELNGALHELTKAEGK